MIWISYQDFSLCAHVDHREVFEQLAANGSSSDHEGLQFFDFLCALTTDHNFDVSELLSFWHVALLQLSLDLWQFWHHFVEVEGEELADRHVLVRNSFDGLLSH